ncbi:hypothetical protein [Microbacterium caowuchunii]|uniref:Integral membrane protein n=1 Tax=Microbacterium caowuchunii TaxID=2614638 RepID=A0A5N0T7Y3_9MICO|nr:hypothetical protein [Microbacterium caowuchunii]KAA9129926.1 hypothetical protein F6B40_14615 [Microbacterium caowuchunii]
MVTTDDAEELREHLATLERENAELRAHVPDRRRAGAWRAVLSALCIVLATILVPVATVGGWARAELVDEESFLATFGPMADDPEIQRYVIETASAAIVDAVDVEQLTGDLFDGIATLGLPERAQAALTLLRSPAAEGVKSLIGTGVTTAVESDAFPQAWRTALVASHRALAAAATGDPSGTVTLSATGEVGIQLAPIIEEVKTQLVVGGFAFAGAIPAVDVTIVVAQSDSLVLLSTAYALADAIGWWLPVVTLALFAGGVLLARDRRIGMRGAGIGLAIGGFLLAAAFSLGAVLVPGAAPSLGLPAGALSSLYAHLVGRMQDTGVLLGLIGVFLIILAWAKGPARTARSVRTALGGVNESIRRGLAARGLRTGHLGATVSRHAASLHVGIVVVALAVLFVVRPLSAGTLWTVALVAVAVWWATELIQPPRARPDAPADAPVPAEPLRSGA